MRLLYAAAAVLVLALPVQASAAPRFADAVDTALDAYVLPAHARFADAADDFSEAATGLCDAPDPDRLNAARAAFAGLVGAFAWVEMFRFGPAREDHRIERLFFWPDRKGRGLRQVQGILGTEDETAATTVSLRQKSVAVQGLPAVEFLLHGTGAEDLLAAGSFRCRYLTAAAGAVAFTARALDAGWRGADGYAALMRGAGTGTQRYRSHGEAVQDLLKAAREQLQIVRELKLAHPLDEKPAAANPKRAPLWRSDATLAMVLANIDAVAALMADGGFAALLHEQHASLPSELAFELANARAAIADAMATSLAFADAATDAEARGALTYALIPLDGAIHIVGERYPVALGLTLGFNALDGD